MRKIPALLPAIVLTAGTVAAQGVSAVVTPNPAPVGQPITLTITEAQGTGIQLPSSCVYTSIHSGGPTGPVVAAPLCLAVITPVPAWGTRSQTWNQQDNSGQQVPSGRYWFEIRYWDNSFTNIDSDFFCVDVAGAPGFQTLVATTGAQTGQPLLMDVQAPAFAGGVYVAAASLTTDTTQTFAPITLCLDDDVLFNLSFPVPHPALFANFQGALDVSGNATGLTVLVPNLPQLQCLGLHVAARAAAPVTGGGGSAAARAGATTPRA